MLLRTPRAGIPQSNVKTLTEAYKDKRSDENVT